MRAVPGAHSGDTQTPCPSSSAPSLPVLLPGLWPASSSHPYLWCGGAQNAFVSTGVGLKLLSRQPRTQVNVISEAWEHSEGSPRGKLRRTGRGSQRCGWAGSAQGAGVSDRESPGWALGAGSWLCTSVRSGVILQAAVVKGCPLAFRVLVGLGSGLMAIL